MKAWLVWIGIEGAVGLIIMLERLAAALLTVRVAVPFTPLVVAVTVAVPAARALAIPPTVMLATFESDELHCTEAVMSLVVPSLNLPVALNC